MCTEETLGAALLARARNAIVTALDGAAELLPEPSHPRLAEPGATFVTLTQNGALRGCIGSLEARRVLDHDVRENARAAAFRDPRFPPLCSDELQRTRIEVSLLTAAEPLQFLDENDALRQLRPGVDGIIFEAGQRRSTFLPQVWESLPEPQQFLAQLKRKAGLPADFWDDNIRLSRYRVDKW
jgi:AmmeMemoRadiSam system protein A